MLNTALSSRPAPPSPLLPETREKMMRRAAGIAVGGNLVLAALKIGTGLGAGSLAVLGDGIDSSVDGVLALMTLAVSRIAARPADPRHPWGHGRAETVATALLACTLFFAGGQLALSAAGRLIAGVWPAPPPVLAIGVTLVSIGGKAALAWSQFHIGAQAGSAMLRANGTNMAADVGMSAGVLAGLGAATLTGLGWIDSAAAILVGLWVIWSAVGIFCETNQELMDGTTTEYYPVIFDAVHAVPGAGNPHRTRMRRIAGLWDIDLDIEVAPDLTVGAAHQIATAVEEAIKARLTGVYDIMVHVEPAGSLDRDQEGYGLQPGTGGFPPIVTAHTS